MWLSYLILAATDLLLMCTALLLGLMLGGRAAGAELPEPLYTKHVLLGIVTLLFTCFVQVIGFTYFVVQGRMAADGRTAGVVLQEGYEAIGRLKRLALRFLLLGVGTILLTAVTGALATGQPAIDPTWHLMAALAALTGNAVSFFLQLGLIARSAELVDRIYGRNVHV